MAEAYIYDAVRTPRGKGKKDGSLHEVKPVNLPASVLTELQRPQRPRHRSGRRRGDGRGLAGRRAGLGHRAGRGAQGRLCRDASPGVQINRFCASGLEAVNMAAAEGDARAGRRPDDRRRRREHVPRAMGSDGGAWAQDPGDRIRRRYFVPQGIGADLIATLVGLLARGRRRLCGGEPEARRRARKDGRFKTVGGAGEGLNRPDAPRPGRAHAARHDHAVARQPQARVRAARARTAASTRSRSSAIRRSSASTTCTTPATRPASSMARPPS